MIRVTLELDAAEIVRLVSAAFMADLDVKGIRIESPDQVRVNLEIRRDPDDSNKDKIVVTARADVELP